MRRCSSQGCCAHRSGLITDGGLSAFVLLNIDEYYQLQDKAPSLFALMQQLPELPDDVLEIPRMVVEFRDVEL